MTIVSQVVESKLKTLGDSGVAKIQASLDDKANEATGWQKSVYKLVSLSVGLHGPAGINKALGALHGLVDGDQTDFDWNGVDLEVASDILARMQNAEAGKNTANRAFLIKVGGVVKDIVGAAIAAL